MYIWNHPCLSASLVRYAKIQKISGYDGYMKLRLGKGIQSDILSKHKNSDRSKSFDTSIMFSAFWPQSSLVELGFSLHLMQLCNSRGLKAENDHLTSY